MKVRYEQVLDNNRKFLKDVFDLSEEKYLEIMSAIGPSSAFTSKYRSDLNNCSIAPWEASNPTRGWCAQMTRFLKDFRLIPEGDIAYCDDSEDHYYFINDRDEVIDLTIYQLSYSNSDDVIPYSFNSARFRPVRTKSSKDAIRLNNCFIKYYKNRQIIDRGGRPRTHNDTHNDAHHQDE